MHKELLSDLVTVLSWTNNGGAGRAAERLFFALQKADSHRYRYVLRLPGVQRELDFAQTGGPKLSGLERAWVKWRKLFRRGWRHILLGRPSFLPTTADLWTGLGREVASSGSVVLNVHWIGNWSISIGELERIPIPIVWTLHDLWPIRGSIHYDSESEGVKRTSLSAVREIRAVLRSRALAKRKLRLLSRSVLVCPSNWIASKAKAETAISSERIFVIPNPIDVNFWSPADDDHNPRSSKRDFRIAFGFSGGSAGFRKGEDLFFSAIETLENLRELSDRENVVISLFGDSAKEDRFSVSAGPTFEHHGHLDAEELRDLYRSSDLMVIASREDNLPQIGTEAQACGLPVIAFQVGGLSDVVENGVTGVLVTAFDVDAMAHEINSLIEDHSRLRAMGRAASVRARKLWSPSQVALQYERAITFSREMHSRGRY